MIRIGTMPCSLDSYLTRTEVGRTICGRIFRGERFAGFDLGPVDPVLDPLELVDVDFDRCSSVSRPAMRAGVALERVRFESFSAPDLLTVSTRCFLNEVVFSGGANSAGIWVRPDEPGDLETDRVLRDWLTQRASSASWQLDVSACSSEKVEVVGLQLENVRWNAEFQAAVRRRWQNDALWPGDALPKAGWVRNSLRRLRTFGAEEGLFGLPSDAARRKAALGELQLLRTAGFYVGDGGALQ